MEDYARAKASWRVEAEGFNELAEELDLDCIGWYAAATQVFKEGTPEGDMIRGTVPTTTDFTPLPDKAQIIDARADEPGFAWIQFVAEHGTKFDVWRKGPGELEFLLVAHDITT